MRLEYEGVGEAAGTSTAPDEDKKSVLKKRRRQD
jgi:hypothetical protein